MDLTSKEFATKQAALKNVPNRLVTTLPVGIDSPSYKNNPDFVGKKDTGYILVTGPKIAYWKKQLMLRNAGSSSTLVYKERELRDKSV